MALRRVRALGRPDAGGRGRGAATALARASSAAELARASALSSPDYRRAAAVTRVAAARVYEDFEGAARAIEAAIGLGALRRIRPGDGFRPTRRSSAFCGIARIGRMPSPSWRPPCATRRRRLGWRTMRRWPRCGRSCARWRRPRRRRRRAIPRAAVCGRDHLRAQLRQMRMRRCWRSRSTKRSGPRWRTARLRFIGTRLRRWPGRAGCLWRAGPVRTGRHPPRRPGGSGRAAGIGAAVGRAQGSSERQAALAAARRFAADAQDLGHSYRTGLSAAVDAETARRQRLSVAVPSLSPEALTRLRQLEAVRRADRPATAPGRRS